MGLLGRRTPNVGRLRRKEDVQGLRAALAYSDLLAGRDGAVIDRGARVRLEAVGALVELEEERMKAPDQQSSPEVVPALASALTDRSETVARAAAEGLGRLGTGPAIDELVGFLALKPPAAQPGVRQVALDGVAASKRAGLTEQWARKVLERPGSLDDLDRRHMAVIMGADSAPDPVRGLQQLLVPKLEPDLPGFPSTQPAEALLEWCMPADVSELAPLLTGDEVPESAIRLAGLSGDQALLNPLVALLERDSATIRREAVAALGEMCDTAAVLPLLVATTDPDVIVRRRSIAALDQLGSAGVTAAMAMLANAPPPATAVEGGEQQPSVAGDRWVRTLERLAERTGLGGRGRRARRDESGEQVRRLVGIRTRYDALLGGPEPADAGDPGA